jgi:CYTH domain-containing protein
MRSTRQFLIAPSFARLIRRERGAARITEGHFPSEGGRSPHVEIDGETANLILVTLSPGQPPQEERTVVPRAHGEALLDVAPGKVQYARSRLGVNGQDVRIDRFVSPGALDIVSVEFENIEEAGRFRQPPWFGPEVTGQPTFQNRSIAVDGIPTVPEIDLNDAALSALIDALEGSSRQASRPNAARNGRGEERQSSVGRLAALYGEERPAPTPRPAGPAPAPAAAPAEAQNGSRPPAEDGNTIDLEIEDDVIRELAYSLRPTGR